MEKKTEENKSNAIITKLIATQNVMKNKFKKAYANRLEGESNLEQSMIPITALTSNEADSSKTVQNDSLRHSSTTKSYLSLKNPIDNTADEANELCDRLRLLLSDNHMNNEEEINIIIRKLHELDILV